MPTPTLDSQRYDLFGWDYESLNPLSEAEIDWHRHWAERVEGPILGLACGGARLVVKLAEVGCEVVGVDLSETMLGVARERVEAAPAEVRRRIRLVRQDMACFDLARQFPLAFIADNSFRELPTRRLLLACLRNIHRHLRPGGRLLIVERRFRPELYADGVRRLPWSQPRSNPATGESVRRRGHVRLHINRKRISGLFEYEVTDPQGRRRLHRCPWSNPVLELPEYLSLFDRAGFDARVFSDYALVPGGEAGNCWCFVCDRR